MSRICEPARVGSVLESGPGQWVSVQAVLRKVSSWITTRCPSLVRCTSSSSMSAPPSLTADLKAWSVFEGASSSPP